MKSRVKKVLQKVSAIALVLGMSLTPCITGFGKVFADEPDTNGDADVTYDVTIADSEHGKVQFKDSQEKTASFKENDEVTLKITPDSSYDLEKLSVLTGDGKEIGSASDGTEFQFKMPAADLTVQASFKGSVIDGTKDTEKVETAKASEKTEEKKTEAAKETQAEEKKDDTTAVSLDAVTEKYIKDHINEKYAKADKFELANILLVKQTMVDGSKLGDLKTIDEVIASDDVEKIIYATLPTHVSVYNVSDDSDYLVAYANTMQNDKKAEVIDQCFAYNNNDGQVIDSCIYDAETGLAYIPKSLYVGQDGSNILSNVQLQLLQKEGVKNPGKVQSDVTAVTEKDGKVAKGNGSVSAFDCETSVKTNKGLSKDEMVVSMNGIPLSDDDYKYNSKTGQVTVDQSSAAIQSLSVKVEDQDVVAKIKSACEPMTAKAASVGAMEFTGLFEVPSSVTTGTYFEANAYYAYGSSGFTGVYGYGESAIQELANLVYYGGTLDVSRLQAETTGTNIYISCPETKWGPLKIVESYTDLCLMCGHISNPMGNAGTGPVGGSFGWVPMAVRVLDINRGQGYMLLGVLTKTTHTQAGCGVFKVKIKPNEGYIQLNKQSLNLSMTDGNTCYSLEGAKYGVYKDAACTQLAATLTTDANGNTGKATVEPGKYWVKEIEAPKGYEKDSDAHELTVVGDQTSTLKLGDVPGNDPAAIEINKIDQETGSLQTQGAASLEGAQFTLTHYGKYYTEEQIKSGEADKDAEENGVAKRTWVIQTKEEQHSDGTTHFNAGLDDFYKVSGDDFYTYKGIPTLPLGTLVVEETKAPNGYNLDGAYFTANGSTDKIDGKYVAQITKEGDIVKLNGGNEYSVSDRVIRGDISFTKMDEEEQSRMAGIPFKITSNTTGESHIVVTDENGYFSSASSFNKHSKDTNGGKADSGLWFGLNADGKNVEVNDEYGAFPYDTYTIEEQRCDANKDKALYKGTFTVSRDNYQIDLGTIDNPDLTISTTVKDEETNSHYAQACDDVTLIDTVSYTGLKKNKEYTLSGVLVDKDTGNPILDQNGNQITATTKFKPKTAEGTAEVEFAFDATGFDGKTVVVYETLTLNGEEQAQHKDINDEGQTIYFPGVGTTALDKKTNDHISKADKEITIVDTVRYTNLRVGKKYTVKGVLMDQKTGKKVLDADGQEVTASASFTAKTKDGTVDITFKFDGSKLSGKTVVAFEDVYYKDKLYASHADLNDESQTVQIPKIGTKAADVKTGTDLSLAEKEITITDKVSYENLIVGKSYTVKGTLMDRETGKALEVDGKKVTAEKTFVADQTSGTVDLSFTFDGSKLAGKTTVVFEDLTYNNVSVAVHEDLNDEGQTVHIPKIGTTAISDATGINVNKAEKEVSLTDTVKFENLVKGREYKVTGKLMDQATGEPLLVNGKEVTAEKSFTPDKESGSVDITFKFDADALAGQSVVAFETVTYKDHVIAVHTDINDEGQTVHFPEIKTTALDSASKDHVGFADKEMTIIDTVKYTNLVKDKEYTIKGVLMDKETGKVVLDKDGNQVTAEKTFKAEKADGSVDLVFTFDSSLLAGKTVVAFEDVYYKGISVGTHADINDEEQSVHLPKIQTTAVDGENGTKNSMADSTVIIKDTVSFENLIPGKEYTMKGVLKDQETGKTVKAKVGTDTSEDFVIPDGAEVVNFEKGSYAYVAEGNDTVKPGLYEKTDAGYVLSGTEDAIELDESLITWSKDFTEAAEGYIQDGNVVIRPTAQYTFSEKEEDVTAETTFTPEEANGTVELTFVFDGSEMAGKTFVVFEDAYYNDVKVATHSDIEDKDQTVYVPEIHTTAKDAESGTQNALASKTVKIVDTVDYKNLIVGKEYTVSGKLYDKATEKPLLVDGKEVTGETTFTAEKSEGSVEVVFEFDGSALKNQTIVAFEDLYIDGKQVATHSDINDKDQSIYFPEIHTTATDKADGDHQATATSKVTITDAVQYENLLPGAKYKVVGTLMDKETGKAVLVNGNEVKSESEFTAEKESGTVNVDFTFDASKLGGKSVVVYEKLYTAEGKEIANHEDINDEGQTVKLVSPPKPSKGKVQTGDSMKMYGLIAGAGALVILGGAFLLTKGKKKDTEKDQEQK